LFGTLGSVPRETNSARGSRRQSSAKRAGCRVLLDGLSELIRHLAAVEAHREILKAKIFTAQTWIDPVKESSKLTPVHISLSSG
jgi:hypothetical protein